MSLSKFEQKWSGLSYSFPSANFQQAFNLEQQNMARRHKQITQTAIGQGLSNNDKDEYGDDILHFMFENELKTLPDVASIDIQTEIQWYMRPYLVDFIVEAHGAFSLTAETFFLTLNVLDRYCSKRVVYRKHYQLVGCTALLIASKYEETSKQVPHIKELVGMCCGLYDDDMFIQMECHILATLDWHTGTPTCPAFVKAALSDGPRDPDVENLATYIGEIAMYHRQFISLRPSDIARASITLAHHILGRENLLGEFHWSNTHDHGLVQALAAALPTASDILKAKYKQAHHGYVSLAVETFVARQMAIAQALQAQRTLAVVQNAGSTALTPRKRRFPYDGHEMPLTPPITPSVDAFNKMSGQVQPVFGTPTTPGQDAQESYDKSFLMVDAP